MITTPPATPVQRRAPATSAPSSGETLVQETRREIQRLAHEIGQLAQSRVPLATFRHQFLERLTAATGGIAAAWWESHDGGWRLEAGHQLDQAALLRTAAEQAACARTLAAIPADRFPLYMAPPADTSTGTDAADSPALLLTGFAPDAKRRVTIQVFRRPIENAAAQRGYVQFLAQMTVLAQDYYRRQQPSGEEGSAFWRGLDALLRDVHRRPGREARSAALAEAARRLLGCDRVSIAWRSGKQLEILAISGAPQFDGRAEDVQRLKRLARCAAEHGRPIDSSAASADLTASCQLALDELRKASKTQAVAVLPLNLAPEPEAAGSRAAEPWQGALICEQVARPQFAPQFAAQAATLAAHGVLALHSAGAGRPSSAFRRSGSKRRWAWILALLPALVAVLALVPAPLRIAAHGKLLPSERFDIFAHDDGTITEVHAQHAQLVAQGAVLAEMQSTELAVQISEVTGQRDKTIEQLHAREQLLVQSQDLNPLMQQQLAGEVSELKQTLRNLQHRLELYRKKQARLLVRSPIRGQVVTWDVEDSLLRRPVRTGQVLMSVVNPDGPWELELYVPERRLGNLLDTLHTSEAPVQVQFQLHSQSGQEFTGTVMDYHRLAEMRGEEGNTVLVRVAVDKDEIPHLHNETSVSAQILCGTRPLGGVLFQDVIETAQRTWLYWF